MLFAEKADLFCVLAVQHAHAQPDIVARPKLIDQPADAVRVVGLMARHSLSWTKESIGRLGYRGM